MSDAEDAWMREKFDDGLRQARAARDAYESALADGVHLFATVTGETVHDRSCTVVAASAMMADDRLTIGDPINFHSGGPPSWPELLLRDEALARNMRRCKLCTPELPDRTTSRSHLRRKSGLGWPVPNGQAWSATVPPGGCV